MHRRLSRRIRRRTLRLAHIEDAWLTRNEDPLARADRVLALPAIYAVPDVSFAGQRVNALCIEMATARQFTVELGPDWARVYVWPQHARSEAYTRALARRYLAMFLTDDAERAAKYR